MPRLPTYDSNQVRNTPMPAPGLAMQTPDMGAVKGALDNGASALVQGGKDLSQTADKVFAYANKIADDDNKASAQQALSMFQREQLKTLYHDEKAFYRQTGETAYKSYDKLEPALEETRSKYRAGLSEEAAKLYDMHSLSDLNSSLQSAGRHAAAEREKWLDGNAAALADTSAQTAALGWNDPGNRDSKYLDGLAVLHDRAMTKGLKDDDPLWVSQKRDYDSKFAVAVVSKAMVDDPIKGKALFEDYRKRGFFDAKSEVAMASHVEQKYERYAVDAELSRIKAVVAADGQAGVKSEKSGSLDNNPGNLMPGGKFATFATPEEGVAATVSNLRSYPAKYGAKTLVDIAARWAPKDDGVTPALKGNDPAVWARNVGSIAGIDPNQPIDMNDPAIMARVVKGIAQQEKGAGKTGQFTDDVVAKGVGMALGGQAVTPGSPAPAPSQEAQSTAVVHERLMAEAGRIADPKKRRDVEASLQHEFSVSNGIRVQKEREARDQVMDMVLAKKVNPKDIPGELVALVGPDFIMKAGELAKRERQPDFNPALYAQLARQAAEDQVAFSKRNDWVDIAREMPEGDVRHFMNIQMGMDKKQATAMEQGANWNRALTISKDKLRAAGIDPTPKDTDKAGAARMDAFQGAALREIESAQQSKGGKLTDAEIGGVVDRLLFKATVRGSGIFGVFQTEKPIFERKAGEVMTVPYDDIPKDKQQAIVADFMEVKKRQPTKAEIEETYTLYAMSKAGAR